MPDTPAAAEPIVQRIIEMPDDLERTELRDDASGFIAYLEARPIVTKLSVDDMIAIVAYV